MQDYLAHYGRGHEDGGHSGRYPWGSGENPCQREMDFISRYNRFDAQGLTPRQIAEKMDIKDRYGNYSTRVLKARLSIAKEQVKVADISLANKLANQGYGPTEIGKMMGKPESTIRGYLTENRAEKATKVRQTANVLKELADSKGRIDISDGAEIYLGVTKNRLKSACDMLEEQGYHVWSVKINQVGTDRMTTVTALVPPGVTYGELVDNRFDIKPVYNENAVYGKNGDVVSSTISKEKIHSISSDRIQVVYNEEGGVERDGLIELRPGVNDISIGPKHYAQVRIPIDGTYYMKGMAVYNPDLPPGVDIRFNSNKHLGTPIKGVGDDSVLKRMKRHDDGSIDWSNPYGATIKLKTYEEDGKTLYSAAAIVNEEGDWLKWDRNLSSQFGSKQSRPVMERQLALDIADRRTEFDALKALNNPTIQRKLLLEFADNCDRAAVELKAAPFPGQQVHVILPHPGLKDNEIYAPNYADGTVVALVRHPYSGPFESPRLIVRNTGSPARKMIGENAPDAVVINKRVANQMSGADFDGDSVAVIPLNDRVNVLTKPPLQGLKDFDHQEEYRGYKGMEVIKPQTKQNEMGRVSNLITDMTLQGAPERDIVKAVKHSMVIIDAEKHELDWKRSERENDITELKKIYQRKGDKYGGASTIISRAKAQYRDDERKDWKPTTKSIGPNGEKIYSYTNDTYTEVKLKGTKVRDPESGKLRTVYPPETKNGGWIGTFREKGTDKLYYTKLDHTTGKKVRVYLNEDDYTSSRTKKRQTETTRMAFAKDAYTLTSGGSRENYGYPIERVYAEYANTMKAMANEARKLWLGTKEYKKDPAAAERYSAEVESLERKLNVALAYSPKERQAVMMANRTMAIRRHDNPDMDKEHLKKYSRQAMASARAKLGVDRKKTRIDITEREWEAIQAKAISPTKLRKIIDNADPDKFKELATPRATKTISPAMISLAKAMAASGYTNKDISDRLGVSTTSVYNILSGKTK